MQSLILEYKLLLSHSLSINFPLSNDIFICLGNFSPFLIISSLKYLVLYKLSTSNNNCSSLSLMLFLEYYYFLLLFFLILVIQLSHKI